MKALVIIWIWDYIPAEKSGVSVSNTLEYAYDDWCIAQMAKKLNRTDIYDEFIKRSKNWRIILMKLSGFMQPKMADGTFKKEFDAIEHTTDRDLLKATAGIIVFLFRNHPTELVSQMGGKKNLLRVWITLFTMHLPDEFFAETEDITREGIIGGYVHGNEPAHHVAYFYNWTDQPWKTQERVRKILKMQYKPTPDGLGGNDDCGQMSAWYIFSSLGFYPVAPGSDEYALGRPLVEMQ